MISGERQIHLPASILPTLRERGIHQAVLVAKICIDAAGAVSSVDVTKSCGSADGDQSVVAKLRAWKFRPYLVNGQPSPFCTVKMFRYLIE